MNSKIILTVAAIVPFGFVLLALAALAHVYWRKRNATATAAVRFSRPR